MTTRVGDFAEFLAPEIRRQQEAPLASHLHATEMMDWKWLATTFGIVFLAELGDKTQLAALALTGKSGRPMSVFIGASLALVLVTLLGVVGGALLQKVLPEKAMSIASAILFLIVGAFLLIRALFFGEAGS